MKPPTARLAPRAALVLSVAILCGCADGGSGGASPKRPRAIQLDPPPAAQRLQTSDVDRIVSTASADPTTAEALRQGRVARILVRAGLPGHPATVAFLFETPLKPQASPYEVLCDIAGQTAEWRGVAASVDVHSGAIESSPLWMTGANCVGAVEPDGGWSTAGRPGIRRRS